MEKKVLDFVRRNHLVRAGDKIVVAVSGGPDSLCLLHILFGLRRELGIELYVAHLDHQLRGADSAADARYVAGVARRLGIPFTVASRDVRDYRSLRRLSLEEAAREVRYAFLAEVAAAVGAAAVAVGHTADDHAETVLMHLLRGSGTRGLRGLLPVARRDAAGKELNIIRPLLELNRRDTANYCRRHRLSPRRDASNFSLGPLRNRLRHRLLPEMQKYNPQITEALVRTARLAADDFEFIHGEAVKVGEKAIRLEKGAVIIDKVAFSALPAALKRHLLRDSIETLLGNLKDIEAGHVERLMDALDKPAGKNICLHGGLSLTIEYERFVLGATPGALCPFPAIEREVELQIPGKTRIPGWEIEAAVISRRAAGTSFKSDNGLIACFDYDGTGQKLTVRNRVPGDSFQPLGMVTPKKLSRFLIDARVPRAWRNRVPVVASPERIIWVVGWRIDARARVMVNTEKVLRLEFRRSPSNRSW
ncbi:MAG: tRNA lysidine(34) synthetase TilS [Chloroflexi bacterium RBG_16_56_11]|nr:MAG: tRNA lysidine(34) synthetase TilS [Chloroflexi bacterium RBG_16_56_11]